MPVEVNNMDMRFSIFFVGIFLNSLLKIPSEEQIVFNTDNHIDNFLYEKYLVNF